MNTRTIASFSDDIEANLVRGKLQDAGIKCFLLNENISTLMPHYSNMTGGIKLMVNVYDYDRAYMILYNINTGNIGNEVVCPNCSSGNIKFRFGASFLSSLWLLFLSMFSTAMMLKQRNKCICKDCGLKFVIK